MSAEGYYPTKWPYKGTVYANLPTNEDVVPILLVVLEKAVEFWEAQRIDEEEVRSLIRRSRFTLSKASRAFNDNNFVRARDQHKVVGRLADALDSLAPEHTYFGEHPDVAGAYGFYSADSLTGPYNLAA